MSGDSQCEGSTSQREGDEHLGVLPQWSVHSGVECNGCGVKPIAGCRYKCQRCADFDFCEKCYASPHSQHDPGHEFYRFFVDAEALHDWLDQRGEEGTCISSEELRLLTAAVVRALGDSEVVSNEAVVVAHHLGELFEAKAGEASSELSPHLMPLLQALMAVAERGSYGNEGNGAKAYVAIVRLVMSASKDTIPLLQQLLEAILNRLSASIAGPSSTDAQELQTSLLGVLGETMRQLPSIPESAADSIMQLLLCHLSTCDPVGQEEAFLEVSILIDKVEGRFERYMLAFMPRLIEALDVQSAQVRSTAAGVVGDVAREVGEKLTPWSQQIMQHLLRGLRDPSADRKVAAALLGAVSDTALALNGAFEPYLPDVMPLLAMIPNNYPASDDACMDEQVHELWDGVLEAYIGIVHACKAGMKSRLLDCHVSLILSFLDSLAQLELSDQVMRSATGLVGDLVDTCGSQVLPLPSSIGPMIQAAHRATEKETRELALYTLRKLREVGVYLE